MWVLFREARERFRVELFYGKRWDVILGQGCFAEFFALMEMFQVFIVGSQQLYERLLYRYVIEKSNFILFLIFYLKVNGYMWLVFQYWGVVQVLRGGGDGGQVQRQGFGQEAFFYRVQGEFERLLEVGSCLQGGYGGGFSRFQEGQIGFSWGK